MKLPTIYVCKQLLLSSNLYSNTWNHLMYIKQEKKEKEKKGFDSFKNVINKMWLQIIYI